MPTRRTAARTFPLALALAAPFAVGQSADEAGRQPQTRPERTDWTETSTTAEVTRYLRALTELPHGDRLAIASYGRSVDGRDLVYVRASATPHPTRIGVARSKKLRALILANIHGGEVEGKEVVQILLREIAHGGHEDLLAKVELIFVPVFNADGNDQINVGNRVNQNGPDGGVGQRANSQGLDLNRDFVKVESPEVRSLMTLFEAYDPHLFMDLHTTNGSGHGYHLTYSPSLSTNLDPDLDTFQHETFLPDVRARVLADHGFRIFDYGNFPRRGRTQDPSRGWYTFSHAPRLAFNYFGLRNRLSLLSEAYAYLPFDTRAAVTKAFVLESVRGLVRHEKRVREIATTADARIMDPVEATPRFGYASDFREPVDGEILVSSPKPVELPNGLGRRFVASDVHEAVATKIAVRFVAAEHVDYPAAWAVLPNGATDAVRRALLVHGLEVDRLDAPRTDVTVRSFQIREMSRPRYRFQGHQLVTIGGDYLERTATLPAGTLIVSARQRLGRVAAQLLEAVTEDGLVTWNLFDDVLRSGQTLEEDRYDYPVLGLERALPADAARTRLTLTDDDLTVAEQVPAPPRDLDAAGTATIRITCAAVGRRVTRDGAYENRTRWEGRELRWAYGPREVESLDALDGLLTAPRTGGARPALVLRPGPMIRHEEIRQVVERARAAGFKAIYLERKPE